MALREQRVVDASVAVALREQRAVDASVAMALRELRWRKRVWQWRCVSCARWTRVWRWRCVSSAGYRLGECYDVAACSRSMQVASLSEISEHSEWLADARMWLGVCAA